MARILFGLLLGLVGVLYLWLAYMSVAPGQGSGDWVSYLGAVIFLAAGVGAALGAVSLLRARRR